MSLRIAANQPEPTPEQRARRAAMLQGYDGDPCRVCGQRRVARSGALWMCVACDACDAESAKKFLALARQAASAADAANRCKLHRRAMQAAFARE